MSKHSPIFSPIWSVPSFLRPSTHPAHRYDISSVWQLTDETKNLNETNLDTFCANFFLTDSETFFTKWKSAENGTAHSGDGDGITRTKLTSQFLAAFMPWAASVSFPSLPSYQFLTLYHLSSLNGKARLQIHPLILNSNASYPTTLSRWILRSSMPIHPRVLSISCVQGQLVGDISFSNKKVPLLHHWTTAVNLTTTTRTTMTMTTRTRMIGRLPGQVCSCWRSQFFSSWNENNKKVS